MRVAIIGSGVAGLACAARLAEHGIGSALFDKGKRPGGRLSTLKIDDMAWDFGCQYIQPGNGAFAGQLREWQREGLLAPWPRGPQGALVGIPAMSRLIEDQAARHDVRFGVQVQRLERSGNEWFVCGQGMREGPFAAVAVSVPSEQASSLLGLHDLTMARTAATARSRSCWTAMAAFPEPLEGLADFYSGIGPIAWAARNNSKPGRGQAECWVIQADGDWSERHLESDKEVVASALLEIFGSEAGLSLPQPQFLKAHRWRFALPLGQSQAPLWNGNLMLGACGDWCTLPKVEGAWTSGTAMADVIASAHQSAEIEQQLSAAK